MGQSRSSALVAFIGFAAVAMSAASPAHAGDDARMIAPVAPMAAAPAGAGRAIWSPSVVAKPRGDDGIEEDHHGFELTDIQRRSPTIGSSAWSPSVAPKPKGHDRFGEEDEGSEGTLSRD